MPSMNGLAHITVGAKLDGKFRQTFSRADRAVHSLSRELENLEEKSSRIRTLKKLTDRSVVAAKQLRQYKADLRAHQRAMKASTKVTVAQIRMEGNLKRSVIRSEGQLKSYKDEIGEVREELKAAGVDAKNFARAQESISGSTEKVNTRLDKARERAQRGNRFRNIASGTASMASSVSTRALGAITGGAIALASPVMYGHEMARVHALGKRSEENYDPETLNQATLKIGKDFSFTTAEAARAAGDYLQSGFSRMQTKSMLRPTFNLASATRETPENIAQLMIGFQSSFSKTYGRNEDDMQAMTNQIAKTINSSNLKVEDLLESSKYLQKLPEKMGVSFNEMLGILSVSGDGMLKGSMAATSAIALFERLTDPKIQEKIADRFKIDVKDRNTGEFRNVFEIFRDIAGRTKGYTEAERMGQLKDILETEAGRIFYTLADNIEKAQSRSSSFDRENVDKNYTENLKIDMQNSIWGILKRMWSIVDTFSARMTSLFEKDLKGFLTSFAERMNNAASWAERNPEHAKSLAKIGGAGVLAWIAKKPIIAGITALAATSLGVPMLVTGGVMAAGAAYLKRDYLSSLYKSLFVEEKPIPVPWLEQKTIDFPKTQTEPAQLTEQTNINIPEINITVASDSQAREVADEVRIVMEELINERRFNRESSFLRGR